MKTEFRHSLRFRLILDFSIAILIPSIIICLVGVKIIYYRIIRQAQSEVVYNLKSAHEIYNHYLDRIESVIRLTASRFFLKEAVEKNNREVMKAELERILKDENLDTLTVTDDTGLVLLRARNPELYGDAQSHNVMVASVMETGRPVAGAEIVPQEELLKESPKLAAQAYMEFTKTPKAKKRPDTKETSGMMLVAAAPILNSEGDSIGIIYGGNLINRNYEIVDEIKQTVFGNQSYKGREIGTATVFQHDLRISTNVKNKDGSRAITTRVSEEVYDAVLVRGQNWMAEAFVVNDWYITAYEPIRSIKQKIIGMLYVGILKKPFTDLLWRTLFIFLGIAAIGVVLVVFVAFRFAKYIARPMRQLAETADKIAAGDYNQHIDITSRDEIGHLVSSVNEMTVKLAQAHKELKDWARTLERKVEERTKKIEEMQHQLIQSEKLASMGKLAAGVAHEINNPLTAILTNSSLLLDDLPEHDEKREDMQTIVNETIRCRRIVKALLDFARQTNPEKKPVNINGIIDTTLNLVQNQLALNNVTVKRQLDLSIPSMMLDSDQIQQVFLNIVINAIEVMPGGGELTITSQLDGKNRAVAVTITDTGPGISKEETDKIFEPFYTTKESGTGLGLAITYGIVQRHAGNVEVESKPGKGSKFTVKLPLDSGGEQDV